MEIVKNVNIIDVFRMNVKGYVNVSYRYMSVSAVNSYFIFIFLFYFGVHACRRRHCQCVMTTNQSNGGRDQINLNVALKFSRLCLYNIYSNRISNASTWKRIEYM